MASRSFDNCVQELKDKYALFREKMKEAGIDFIVTCTTRTQEEQDRLYAQGRTIPGRIVTWTRKSKHVEGKAFDIVIMRNGKPVWNAKDKDWLRAGEIGESVGLIWGGRFKKVDACHFEI
jgi:peptidoglycan L-alanyl-D-glutamate endopeptidase CwlK